MTITEKNNIKIYNIIITGASSGIGRALAQSLITRFAPLYHEINLFLIARNEQNLANTRQLCYEIIADKKYNCKITISNIIGDVANQDIMSNAIKNIEQNHDIDLIIANAGISAGTSGNIESDLQVKQIFAVNLYGVLNIIHPALQKMIIRKNGQIVVISSQAGFFPLPSSPAYSASKAAIRFYFQALRNNLASFNIKVNVICPGYVKTPMTAINDFPMPFIIDVNDCADKIIDAIIKNKAVTIFPRMLYLGIIILKLLPNKLINYIFGKIPGKKPLKNKDLTDN